MANLILASKREVKSGANMWHVYRLSENNKSEEYYFAQVGKAVRYMFLLRKRGGGIIPKAVYSKIMASIRQARHKRSQARKRAHPRRKPHARAQRRRASN